MSTFGTYFDAKTDRNSPIFDLEFTQRFYHWPQSMAEHAKSAALAYVEWAREWGCNDEWIRQGGGMDADTPYHAYVEQFLDEYRNRFKAALLEALGSENGSEGL